MVVLDTRNSLWELIHIQLLSTASCPVLSIPVSFDETGFNSILYPVRMVEGVIQKYDYIKPIVEKNDAVIHLLGVINTDENVDNEIVQSYLSEISKLMLHDQQFVSSETIQTNEVANEILQIAHERNDDLIIINATLDKKWYHFFTSCFTQQIINHSRIPVLSVKPELTAQFIEFAQKEMMIERSNYVPY